MHEKIMNLDQKAKKHIFPKKTKKRHIFFEYGITAMTAIPFYPIPCLN